MVTYLVILAILLICFFPEADTWDVLDKEQLMHL